MKKYLPIIKKSPLFLGVSDDEILTMLDCLGGELVDFTKGESICRVGEHLREMGLVLTGSVLLEKEDYWGNRTILAKALPGQLFGEVYACMQNEPLHVNVIAVEPTAVLLLDAARLTETCSSACRFHSMLLANLLKVMARKNFMLTQKLEHTSNRTLRRKVASYLSAQAEAAGSGSFTIPFNRQELADYLAVDRSALSSELGRMRDEGIIRFQKNRFEIL